MNSHRASFRRANILVAVTTPLVLAAALLLRDLGEGALQLLGIAMFVVNFSLYALLDRRAWRRKQRDQ